MLPRRPLLRAHHARRLVTRAGRPATVPVPVPVPVLSLVGLIGLLTLGACGAPITIPGPPASPISEADLAVRAMAMLQDASPTMLTPGTRAALPMLAAHLAPATWDTVDVPTGGRRVIAWYGFAVREEPLGGVALERAPTQVGVIGLAVRSDGVLAEGWVVLGTGDWPVTPSVPHPDSTSQLAGRLYPSVLGVSPAGGPASAAALELQVTRGAFDSACRGLGFGGVVRSCRVRSGTGVGVMSIRGTVDGQVLDRPTQPVQLPLTLLTVEIP